MRRKACSVCDKNALGCHGKFATRGLLFFSRVHTERDFIYLVMVCLGIRLTSLQLLISGTELLCLLEDCLASYFAGFQAEKAPNLSHQIKALPLLSGLRGYFRGVSLESSPSFCCTCFN